MSKARVESASTELFSQQFQQEQAALDKQIDQLKDASLSETERANLMDQCLAGVASLSDRVRDASIYTLAYDQRSYAAEIKNLTQRLQTVRAPRRKFAFNKSKPNANLATSSSDESPKAMSQQHSRTFPETPTVPSFGRETTLLGSSAPTSNTIPCVTPPPASTATFPPTNSHSPPSSATPAPNPTSIRISSQSTTHLTLSPTIVPPCSPLSITEIHNSLIDLTPIPYPLATLTITSTTNSLLICAPVAGAAHITNVKSSVLLLTARQVRMHECTDCIFYLNCTSQPIIEDCTGMKFAPLPTNLFVSLGQKNAFPSSPSHDDKSSATTSSVSNKWAQVADFKWLKVAHSPNWSILPVEDRVDEKVWKTIVADTSSAEAESGRKRSVEGLRDVLRKVGVLSSD